MNIGEKLLGFELISVTPVKELDAVFHLFRHEKNGAELLWTDRRDDNMTFAVAFKTVPEDSTGVFHILEHSVLCGSDKYPVKEPFVELLKGSMQTFLNAMTYPDKTVYPIATRNRTDFRNLMSVYLDAVFAPCLLHDRRVFDQEGWHWEPTEDGRQHVVGVVYGEMEGAYSSVDRVLMQKLHEQLYPDTCYGLSSGGDPVHIPELTYEQYVAAYQRYYHPSNARFFLDGSVDLETAVADICEYVDRFERRELDFEIAMQQPVSGICNDVYEISPEDQGKGQQCYFAMGKLTGTWSELEDELCIDVLGEYLAGSNEAPMKQRVIKRGLGKDFSPVQLSGTAQRGWALMVRNTDEDKLPVMKQALQDIAREILDEGLDREELLACMNHFEFMCREHREPHGVYLCVDVLQSWLYGGDPSLYVALDKLFMAVRAKLDTDYFEQLLRRLVLDEDGMCEVRLTPSATLGEEKRQAAQARADAVTSIWDDAEKTLQAERLRQLNEWHQQPDSPENLATIPHLSLDDLTAEPKWMPAHAQTIGGVTVLKTEINTSGPVYLEMAFDLGDLTEEELSAAALLVNVLGQLPTEQHSAKELQHQVRLHLGSLGYRMRTGSVARDVDHCTPYLNVNCSVLPHEARAAVELIHEVLNTTRFDDVDAIRTIMTQLVESMQRRLVVAGNSEAMLQAAAGQSADAYAEEKMSGYSFQLFMKELLEQDQPEVWQKLLENVSSKLTAGRMTVCVSGDMDESSLADLCAGMKAEDYTPVQFTIPVCETRKVALSIPASVGYATLSTNVYRMEGVEKGKLIVMNKLLSLNQLWNEIRVQGGAYGAGINTNYNGCLSTYSYRDPNPANSMKVYRTMADYLERYCQEKKPLEEIIIGAVSDCDPLMSPRVANAVVLQLYLNKHTLAYEREVRNQILSTTHENLLPYCDVLRRMADEGSVCVVGSEPMLAQLADEKMIRRN